MRHLTLTLALITAIGSPSALASTCDFTAVDARFDTLLQEGSLSGGAILIGTDRGLLHERYVGDYDADTVVPIASATKLLSALRIGQLVERGVLDIDAPVHATLPNFTGLKGEMTLRQMFSHTAGYGNDEGHPVLSPAVASLENAVNFIACCVPFPKTWTPGGQFAYGGISMHVAGRVAEVATATDWQSGWQQGIGAPLGISTIDWQGLGPTQNYRIGGGARSNLRDYGRVMQMLAADGVGNGRRVLGPEALAVLFADHVDGLPIAYAPPNAPSTIGYGLGNWIEPSSMDAPSPTVSSLGAFGFFPWLDLHRSLFGVFMIRGDGGINALARPAHERMMLDTQAIVDQAIADGDDCDVIEPVLRLFVDAFEDLEQD